MKFLSILFFFTVFTLRLFSQEVQIKAHIKNTRNEPVEAVNVFVNNNPNNGIVSNEDGFFIITVKLNDTLAFSHINYKPQLKKITKMENVINVVLEPYDHELKEIKVSGKILTAKEIIQKTSQNLKANHYSQNNFYEIFTRNWSITNDKLYVFEEYVVHAYEKKTPPPKYKIIKGRSHAFSEKAKENFENHTLSYIYDIWEDYYLLVLVKCLNEKKLDKYTYSIKQKSNIDNLKYYNIISTKNGSDEKIEFLIDKYNFGVKQMKFTNVEQGFKTSTCLNYICIKEKWYLKSSKYYSRKINSTQVYQKFNMYKLIESEKLDDYQSVIKLLNTKASKCSDNFDDTFWKDYDYIPIPEKIKEMMGE